MVRMMERLNEWIDGIEIGIEAAKKEEAYVSYLYTESKKKYVYSKYLPKKNARELVDFSGTNKETFWLICGLGLGYVTEEVLRSAGEKTRVVIVEPSEKLFLAQKEYVEKIMEDSRVSVFCGADKEKYLNLLRKELPLTNFKNIKVVQIPVYMEIFHDYYLWIIRMMNEYVQKETIGYNTMATYAEQNIKNIWKNRDSIKEGYNIINCFGRYKNIPAVIVSAGPSLSKNIKYLKEFKGIIFTGTRTLHQLMELGIKPNYLVCVDPTDKVYSLMREYGENDIDLIAVDVASPLVLANNSGKKYILNGTSAHLSHGLFGISLPSLPMEGSVATLCTSSAYYMGCNPIMFIGQDLAYTNNQKHADSFMSVPIREDAICYVESYDGGEIATSPTMRVFIRWFEKFIEEHNSKTQFINCTEGGAKIKGTHNAIFKEMVDRYSSIDYDLDSVDIPLCSEEQKEQFEQRVDKNLDELKQVIKISRLGIKLGEELLDEYQIYKGKRVSKIHSILDKLNKQVDQKLQNINVVVEQVFTREFIRNERSMEYKEPYDETEMARNIRITKRSISLYKALSESIQGILDIFKNLEEEVE